MTDDEGGVMRANPPGRGPGLDAAVEVAQGPVRERTRSRPEKWQVILPKHKKMTGFGSRVS
jgi:hypothetical protein